MKIARTLTPTHKKGTTLFVAPRSAMAIPMIGVFAAFVACGGGDADDDLSASNSNASRPYGAVADSWVRSGSSINSNKGTELELYADATDSGGAERRIFIKFTVSGAGASVLSAKLRLHCTSGSASGGTLRAVSDTSWDETKITWTSQPQIGAVIGSPIGAVQSGASIDLDVSSIVRGDGTYSFALVTSNDDEVRYAAREAGATGPSLVLDTTTTTTDAGAIDSSPEADTGSLTPPPPPSTGDYLLMSRAALKALPTSGAAWTSLKASADASVTPDLCDQDNKVGVNALAAGLVYARTGDLSYRKKAIDLITRAIPTQKDGCYNAILSLGRQLGGYVLAADFADYRDASFVSWLSQIRTREIGGHGRWHQLRFTAGDCASNWCTFSAGSMAAADRFLGDATNVARDWKIFQGYTDGSWPFNTNSSYQPAWNCGSYIAIENRQCKTPGGLSQNGAPVEDASRLTYPTPHDGYVSEAMQGFVFQALLLNAAGYDSFGIGGGALSRVAAFQVRFGIANGSSPGYYTMHVVNHVYGTSYPEKTPTSGGRIFGFADWLYP